MLTLGSTNGPALGPLLLALTSVACLSQATQTYRQQRQPQTYQHSPSAARYHSDLVHSASFIDLPSPLFKSRSHKLASQENQINEKSGQPYKSGRTMINGNHATYVEPPANFKPIIYEHPQEAPGRQQPSDPPATTTTGNGNESFMESPNQLVASMLAPAQGGQSRQPQRRQTQAPPSSQSQTGADSQRPSYQSEQQQKGESVHSGPGAEPETSNSADEAEDEANSLPLKPSIDRWSDWTDMSVDPDLASSETQQSQTSSAPADLAQSNQRPQQQAATRISSQHERHQRNERIEPASSQAADLTPAQILPLIHQLYQQQRMFAANSIRMQQPPVHDSATFFESKRDYSYQATQPAGKSASELNANANPHEHYLAYQRPSAPLFYYPPQLPPSGQLARSNFILVNFAPPATEPLAMAQSFQQQRQQIALPPRRSSAAKRMANLFGVTAHENCHQAEPGGPGEETRNFRPASAEAKPPGEWQRRFHRLSGPQEVMFELGNFNKQVSDIGGSRAAATSRVLTP